MRARLGVNNCFAVKRYPRPDDWASIVRNDLGLDLVELSLDLLAGPDTAAGTAMLAGLGAGVYHDVAQAVAAAYRPGPVAEPDPRHRGLYDEMYGRYLALTGSEEG